MIQIDYEIDCQINRMTMKLWQRVDMDGRAQRGYKASQWCAQLVPILI